MLPLLLGDPAPSPARPGCSVRRAEARLASNSFHARLLTARCSLVQRSDCDLQVSLLLLNGRSSLTVLAQRRRASLVAKPEMELIMPTPPQSDSSDPSSPSTSIGTSLTTLPSTLSLSRTSSALGKKARDAASAASTKASANSNQTTTERYGWLLYALGPSHPAVTAASAIGHFSKPRAQKIVEMQSESELWADDEAEHEEDGATTADGTGRRVKTLAPKHKRALIEPSESTTSVIKLLSEVLPAANPSPTDKLPFTFVVKRGSTSASSSRPRRRGAPIVYVAEERTCTCMPEYQDDSSTTSSDDEDDRKSSVVEVRAPKVAMRSSSLFLRGAMVRCSGL